MGVNMKKKTKNRVSHVLVVAAIVTISGIYIRALFNGFRDLASSQQAPTEIIIGQPAVPEVIISGPLGETLDDLEKTLIEDAIGIVIHDSGAKVSMASATNRPPKFLSEQQIQQMQEEAKLKQTQKTISSP